MRPRLQWSAGILSIVALALLGCSRPDPASAGSRVEILPAPANEDLKATVQREVARAKADGRDLLVYVGATWCEPCKHFHDAAAAGELDKVFPTLRLVEFDLDRDRERLLQAGYRSKMIPLFAVPRADGTGSGQQIEGSIKGSGAVDEITPKLRDLIARARAGG
jgi:hypothetical protein